MKKINVNLGVSLNREKSFRKIFKGHFNIFEKSIQYVNTK